MLGNPMARTIDRKGHPEICNWCHRKARKNGKRLHCICGWEAMIVDFSDLQRLSGRERPAAVKKWLQSQGIHYILNANGQPVTTEKVLNHALLRGRKTEPHWPTRTRQ